MSAPDHAALLDQLQAQVNLVLEQTGRVFAALNSSPKAPPIAQITKLKNVVPTASNRFHQALDQLENELQMAALVMRRDLAVYREQASGEAIAKISSESLSAEKASASVEIPGGQVSDEPAAIPNAKQDVLMEDKAPAPAPEADSREKPTLPDAENNQPPPPAIQPSPKGSKPDVVPEAPTDNSDAQSKLQNDILHIDTAEDSKADHKPAEEKATDTATGDLDSLFNDPTSAVDANDANAFNFDQNNSNELDFGSFGAGFDSTGADNDNISSLLPGLEDYANTQTNAANDVMDFDSFFNTDDNGQNNGLDQQGSGEQRDTTFDDLMDLANFEGIDGDDNNNNGNNQHADLDFEALFN